MHQKTEHKNENHPIATWYKLKWFMIVRMTRFQHVHSCEWAGAAVLSVMPTATRKHTSPYKIANHWDDSRKHKKKKETYVYFYSHTNIFYYCSNWKTSLYLLYRENFARACVKNECEQMECFLWALEKYCTQQYVCLRKNLCMHTKIRKYRSAPVI